MEVFSKYFRRLLVGNSPQIFPGTNRNVENPSNYQLLVQEMEKIKQDPEQTPKIAEIIDTSEGDIFRDFDLATFMNHFGLDPLAKTLLASAFTHVSKPDLKAKGGAILVENFDGLIASLANLDNDSYDVAPSLLATCALRFFEDLPQDSRTSIDLDRVGYALKHRYSQQGMALPSEVRSVLFLFDLLEMNHHLVKEIQLRGPQITSSTTAAKDFLSRHTDETLVERHVACALLFMVLVPTRQQYSPTVFVSAVHDYVERFFDWQMVVRELDLKGLEISKDQFLALYNALLPMSQENAQFDIQQLWGGRWRNPQTQVSFIRAFLSCPPSELDATSIPDLRPAYDAHALLDAPENVAQYAERAIRDTMISLDAVTAIFDLIVRPDDMPSQEVEALLAEIIRGKEAFFLCSSAGMAKPWSKGQEYIMSSLLRIFLDNGRPDHSYVLHSLWKQDKGWVATKLVEIHINDPLELTLIMDLAREQAWLDDLLTLVNGFGLDLAALAHREGILDLEDWADDKITQDASGFVVGVWKFLMLKAADELRIARDEQSEPRTVSLAMKTVYEFLAILDQHMVDRAELKGLQRQCLQAYPRLIIYCEGTVENIDVDCKESNRLPKAADHEMQALYKRMYNGDLKVENILEYLQECKDSSDRNKVDLFACMIHGLFDEFSCFSEYPLGPLATTAVLFGGIISVRLISDLTLRVGQEMILDSVRDYPQEASMYKFGLQALLHILGRLREPEWSEYCNRLAQVSGLRGTEPYRRALEVLSQNGAHGAEDSNAINGLTDGMSLPNGEIEDLLSPDTTFRFKSVNAEPASGYDEPDEETQEKVVFFFNNVSEQNLKSRLSQLQEALEEKHYQWFAFFLVEGRAKVEPNYQPLYLDILNLLGNKVLWNEVLRETYVSIQKLLNSESTMQSAAERKNLKNLSVWLGSLTIARDKPIKHKNIFFLDFLIEGLETQRLILVVPFTCNVLAQGTRSIVFKPPNPWVMEIVAALLELYFHFDIKLNQKFEIEVLCKELGVVVNEEEASTTIRNRPLHDDDLPSSMLPDGLDGFDDMNLSGINRTSRSSRFDTDTISSALPDLESVLVFPPATGSPATQARLRDIVQEAVRRAITEIIAPVVERSVTIATIATSALIHKDFAREADEDRVRRAAQQMARQLSGSLALVTCKEPLKLTMTNYIRMAQQTEYSDQAFAEGAILMCVNDNLDTACSVVEKQAEERSMPEIEAHIEAEIAQRRQHRAEHPNEPYMDPAFNRWAGFIPDPYKQAPGGLNQEQMAIYLDFARQSRGPASHVQTASADSGRQLPDVLQDAFASVPNVHTPGETLQLPQQAPQQQQLTGRILPPPVPNVVAAAQTNGYGDIDAIHDRLSQLLGDTSRMVKENPDRSMNDIQRDRALVEVLSQAWELIASSPDAIAMICAEEICKGIYGNSMIRLEIEVFVHLLARLCLTYPGIRKEVAIWTMTLEEQKLFNVEVTAALVKVELLHLKQIDLFFAGLIYEREDFALDVLSDLMDALLFNDHPTALRADFTSSLAALGQWLMEDPSFAKAKEIVQRLREWGVDDTVDHRPEESLVRKHQVQYVFAEWVAICDASPRNPNENVSVAFISQLHQRHLLRSEEEIAMFLRFCIDDAMDSYGLASLNADGNSDEPFFKVDWLARLIVLLAKHHGEIDGSIKCSKVEYMDSVLAVLTLIINNHHVMQGERFNQRGFFRLFSSILCDWHDFGRDNDAPDRDMLVVFAKNFLMLTPHHFPAFAYSWLMLISHRLFMPSLLKLSNDEVGWAPSSTCCFTDVRQGWESFAKLMESALSYICQFLKPSTITPLAMDLYRGILRIVLILHHDFPEFLAENHFRLCNSIPRYCTQLHNLVLSAYPSSFPELPDPFVTGLKVDRLEEMRKAPRVVGDCTRPLIQSSVKDVIDASLKSNEVSSDKLAQLTNAVYTSTDRGLAVDCSLLHAVVLYVGRSAIATAGQKGGQPFTGDSSQALLMRKLARELQPEARYYFLSAIAHQLRYPNSHTHYFSYALLHLFGTDPADHQESDDVRQQITRVLLERLHVIKPHPWGLVITTLELIKNSDYHFFQLPFIKASPLVTLPDLMFYV